MLQKVVVFLTAKHAMLEYKEIFLYNQDVVLYRIVKYSSQLLPHWGIYIEEIYLPKDEDELNQKLEDIGQFYTLHLN